MTTEPTPRLDDLQLMQSVDRRNMLRVINDIPEQFETAMGIARGVAAEPPSDTPNVVFISGTGEGALAARMLIAAFAERGAVPVISSEGGRPPKYINQDSRVVLVDYAGTSELSLRAYKDAVQAGSRVACITSGGRLMEAAGKDRTKLIKLPPGQPQRTALGYLLAPLVLIMDAQGWLDEGSAEQLSNAVKGLKLLRETFRAETATARNIAKRTAIDLYGRVPCIYGAVGYRQIVAQAWKRLINANSKTLAITGSYPEFTDSEISGWELASKQGAAFRAVLLKDAGDKSEIAQLMAASMPAFEEFGSVEIRLTGMSTIEKLLHGIYLGHYVSYYLAQLYEVDPSSAQYMNQVRLTMAPQPKPPAPEPAPAEDPGEQTLEGGAEEQAEA